MHTHHSHSGQYVQHAKDSLEDVVESAIAKEFKIFCLTEHMPRYHASDLYPEEVQSKTEPQDLINTFEEYYKHAKRLQAKVNEDDTNELKILVGFEAEGLSQEYMAKINELKSSHEFDLVVGSVHHVHGVPIDFDAALWTEAARVSFERSTVPGVESSEHTLTEAVFMDFFDLQYTMLTQVNPTIVGHFDLIRLFAPPKYLLPGSLETYWPTTVWTRILRNVRYAISIGALFELNSSAIRKGWDTPYPRPDIARMIIQEGGKFCLSDDSHGTAQVGLNLHKCVDYMSELNVTQLHYLDLENGKTIVKSMSLEEVKADPFWIPYKHL